MFEVASEGVHPVIGEVHLLEPFIAATRAALSEMAGTEVGVRAMVQKTLHHALGDIAAVVGLHVVRGLPTPEHRLAPWYSVSHNKLRQHWPDES